MKTEWLLNQQNNNNESRLKSHDLLTKKINSNNIKRKVKNETPNKKTYAW